ncbi:MAG TPA: exonuclease domain-containing protein [Tepidisphaeraceae bacterium]|nr:exonuclease domain-containing protein [Tepidisphaeraceae bacterium]
MRFIALEFRRANQHDQSVCAVGTALFDNGKLIDSSRWSVKPPAGFDEFYARFTAAHGITASDVRNAPEFPEIAPDLFGRLESADFVVVHEMELVLGVLLGLIEYFKLPCPEFRYICTLDVAFRLRSDLPTHSLTAMAEHLGHPVDRFHPPGEAIAVGRVLLSLFSLANPRAVRQLTNFAGPPRVPLEPIFLDPLTNIP